MIEKTNDTKRVVITGGAGFIGSHLARRLVEDGHIVTVIDNLITGDLENIADLIDLPTFEFLEQDINSISKISGKVDYIFHLASIASPKEYLRYPLQTAVVGSIGTLKILDIAKEKRARFLLASTSEIYGDPKVHPQREDYWGNVNPIGPRAVYDESKRFSETVTITYHRLNLVDVRIARIFNTYGPNMRKKDGRAIPNFIFQALTNEPLTIHGSGKQTRSFCFVSDMIEGLIKLMQSNYSNPVNLGNPNEVSILELAKKVIKLSNSRSQITFTDPMIDDPKVRKPDISLARKILQWEPKISLEDGLRQTIAHFSRTLVKKKVR